MAVGKLYKPDRERAAKRHGDLTTKGFRFQEGENRIRILPPTGDGFDFGREVYMHFSVGTSGRAFICPMRTVNSDDKSYSNCYVCEKSREFFKSRKAGDVEKGRALQPRLQVFYNALDMSKAPKLAPILLRTGSTIYLHLLSAYKSEDGPGDFTDLKTGRVITVTKIGPDEQAKYTTQVSMQPTDISKLEKQLKEGMTDLDVHVEGQMVGYEDKKNSLEGTLDEAEMLEEKEVETAGEVELEPEVEQPGDFELPEEEEEKPAAKKPPAKKGKR